MRSFIFMVISQVLNKGLANQKNAVLDVVIRVVISSFTHKPNKLNELQKYFTHCSSPDSNLNFSCNIKSLSNVK